MAFVNQSRWRRLTAFLVLATFLFSPGGITPALYADGPGPADIVALGLRINPAGAYSPPVLSGIKVYAENPFRFDFLLDKGDADDAESQLRGEASRLIKYFLAALTISEKDLWVNLSPYEKERSVPPTFGQTGMGRDMIVQDYLFKQLAVSLLDTSGEVGKAFWSRIYSEAYSRYGTTDIPVDTFNKLWILPDRAEVYESTVTSGVAGQQAVAYVTDLHLKVFLQPDTSAPGRGSRLVVPTLAKAEASEKKLTSADVGRQIIREVVIPVLEKEVNEGERFAKLRQLFHSLVLAAWYKRKIGTSLLSAVYVDREKIAGVLADDTTEFQRIWEQYVDLFEKGSRNYIKKERYQFFDDALPTKYFTGGVSGDMSVLTFQGTADKVRTLTRGKKMGLVEVSLSSVFRRNSRFGLDEKRLVNLFFDAYQRFFEQNGRGRVGLTSEDLFARLKVANRAQSLKTNPLLAKTYAYLGYASLVSALRTHLAGGEEYRLAASFLFYGPVQTYFRYVGGGLKHIYNPVAFLDGALMLAVGGGMPTSGGILTIGLSGYFLSILPPGNMLEDGITFPTGEVWYKRDIYNADFIISENVACQMEQQFNLPNYRLFAHAYGYLMSSKLGFHDYTYFEDSNRKVSITDEQQYLELATQLVSVVSGLIPGDLREQEALARKLAPVLLGAEFAWAVQLSDMRGSQTMKKELRAAIERRAREEILNQLNNEDYVVPKYSRDENWFPLYGYALAKLAYNYYRDLDKSLSFLYQLSQSGDARKSLKIVEKKYAVALTSIWSAESNKKKKAPWKFDLEALYKKDEVHSYGEALNFNVSPELLEQNRNSVGFDPVILELAPLGSLSEFLGPGRAGR